MAIASSTYSAPVNVNGFACRSCADVSQAKRGVDPANPTANLSGGAAAAKALKKAIPDHFSPEARQREALDAAHRSHVAAAASPVASAYASSAPAPRLVNIAA